MAAQNHDGVRVHQRILDDQPSAHVEEYENSERRDYDQYPCPDQPSAQFRSRFTHKPASPNTHLKSLIERNDSFFWHHGEICFRLEKNPGKEQIVAPLGAVLSTKRPQQQKRENDHFEGFTAVRAPHVQAPAKWVASRKIEPSMLHDSGCETRMLTRPTCGVNPQGESRRNAIFLRAIETPSISSLRSGLESFMLLKHFLSSLTFTRKAYRAGISFLRDIHAHLRLLSDIESNPARRNRI